MVLSVIIPAYNEEGTVGKVVEEALSVALPPGVQRQIIVVNDGSTDQTAQVLKLLQEKYDILVLRQFNQGKTVAIKRGLSEARGDVVLIQDADWEYSPREYPKLIEPLLSGTADVVYGSRFLGTIKHMTAVNFLANRLSNITFNMLHHTHITDINTCFKLFRRHIFDDIFIASNHFTFETEITSKLIKHGHDIIEVPIDYEARSPAMGKKINPRKAIAMYFGIFRYWQG